MVDWSYVVLAYLVVWATIAGYAVVLQRRITRSGTGVDDMRQTIEEERSAVRQEEPACDPVSAP